MSDENSDLDTKDTPKRSAAEDIPVPANVAKVKKDKVAKQKKPKQDEVEMGEPMMLRVNFYRDNYRFLMSVTLVLVLIAIVLLGWVFYQRTHKPPVRYFATTTDGQLRELSPKSYPNLTTSILMDWTVEAATAAYNFDFQNYQTAINNLRGYFTPAGFQNYLTALNAAGTIKQIREKRLVVFAVPTDTPVILQEGPTSENLYAWQIQLPLLVTYQSASDLSRQNLVLTMLVSEMPTRESPKGIGIASMIVREKT